MKQAAAVCHAGLSDKDIFVCFLIVRVEAPEQSELGRQDRERALSISTYQTDPEYLCRSMTVGLGDVMSALVRTASAVALVGSISDRA